MNLFSHISKGGWITACCLVSPLLHAVDLVPAGSEWRFQPGIRAASSPDTAQWRSVDFDDTEWLIGDTPLVYGLPFTGTELNGMQGAFGSVYLRRVFPAGDLSQADALILSVLCDDGFVAWINGTEVARANVPSGELSHDAVAASPVTAPLEYRETVLGDPGRFLVAGENVLAIHAFNASVGGSPDFAIDARLSLSTGTPPPVVAMRIPMVGAVLDHFARAEVQFSVPVQGVDAGDLLANGTPAIEVKSPAPDRYVFRFADVRTAGPLKLEWGANHGIRDLAGGRRAFAGGDWGIAVDPAMTRESLVISEIMASNDRVLLDDDCDNPDWIEIHNQGAHAVALRGWALTDTAADPAKWQFPEVSLQPSEYRVVFCSRKDKSKEATAVARACRSNTNALAGLHTNFKLRRSGDYLALVAPDGEVVSSFEPAYPPQTRDVSYGKVPGQPGLGAFFERPTPGGPNAAPLAGFAPAVEFSRPSGTFPSSFRLSLAVPDAAAVIRYTLDGTTVTEASPIIHGPLLVMDTIQVRARAFSPGRLPGPPSSATYLRLTNSPAHLASFTSALPILVFTTLKPASILTTKYTPVHLCVFEPEGGQASISRLPTLNTRAGLRVKGPSTGGQPQSDFNLELWDESNQDSSRELLGMPAASEWVLRAPSGFDPTLMHYPLTMELSRQMGDPASIRTRFVEVYLNRGGALGSNHWFGLYVLMEKPSLAPGRIEGPKARAFDVNMPEVTGAYLFKTDRFDETGTDTGFNAGGSISAYVEPKEKEMKSPQRAPQLAYLSNYFKAMDASMLVTNPKRRDPLVGYRAYLEITNWMDFHLLETLSGNVDAIRLNTYFYKPRDGKLRYGPHWNAERAWESKDDTRDDNPRIWDTGGGLFGRPWWNDLFQDVDAWQLWVDRWQYHRRGTLSLENIDALINRLTNEVRWVQEREALRWRETAPRRSYPNEIFIMKRWISNRVAWIDSQFTSPPRLDSPGGRVTAGFQLSILPPADTSDPANLSIYYTLDGTDPRPIGGTNAITALKYDGPITITRNAHVVARALDTGRSQKGGPPSSTPWSGPVSATFATTAPDLVPTELMFHPAPPSPGSPWSAEDFEFVELKNISDHTVDPTGYHFVGGIRFTFRADPNVLPLGPGARLLLVRNREAFLWRYPANREIAGEFKGNLGNAGDRLALNGPMEEPIFDLAYSDTWAPLTDGLGFSLVLRDEGTPPTQLSDPNRWRSSALEGGSPGFPDPPPPAIPPVFVNEVVFSDVPGKAGGLELFNPGNSRVDVSGWWLSDEFDFPRKHRIAPGSHIEAFGHLFIEGTRLGLGTTGFSLSPSGGGIWLFSADSEGDLTGGFHGFELGASASGTSLGRHVSSDGDEHFVPQLQSTAGLPNSGPQVGPVVVSEMAIAQSGAGLAFGVRDEFIELRNLESHAVPLFDPRDPRRIWRLRGDVDFDLPPSISLPPNGLLLVVPFDPVREPGQLAAFRSRYGLDGAVQIVGPWHGNIDAGGPVVRLLQPSVDGSPDGEGSSLPVVEELLVGRGGAWPVDGLHPGRSLVRRSLAGFGDDGANWAAASATPGEDDLDHDGLGDRWEAANGLNPDSGEGPDGPDGDPDGDGFPNRLEARNRTLARSAASALRVGARVLPDGTVALEFAAPGGMRFAVESRGSLEPDSWQTLQEVTVPDSEAVVFASGIPAETNRYFRLRQL